MRKTDKPVRLMIDSTNITPPKNADGVLGEKCNNCGGFGYTIALKGGQIECLECEKTGVRLPTKRELQTQISDMKQELRELKKAILAAVDMGEMPTYKEANHV